MNVLETIERGQLVERPVMQSGDTVRVHVKVREGEKERVQIFLSHQKNTNLNLFPIYMLY